MTDAMNDTTPTDTPTDTASNATQGSAHTTATDAEAKISLELIQKAIRDAALTAGVAEEGFALDMEIPADKKREIIERVFERLDMTAQTAEIQKVGNFGDLYSYCKGWFGLQAAKVGPGIGAIPPTAPESVNEAPPTEATPPADTPLVEDMNPAGSNPPPAEPPPPVTTEPEPPAAEIEPPAAEASAEPAGKHKGHKHK